MNGKILCIGEILWDKFPTSCHIGGAPFNTACHLKQLGENVIFVSRLGNDELGKKTMHEIKEKGLTTEFIQIDNENNTGIVKANVAENGDGTYEIEEPTAWDFISYNQETIRVSKDCEIMVYGTLAQRNKITRETIQRLAKYVKTKVYDVNFRPPFIDRDIIEESMKIADIIKMNEDEFYQMANWFNISTNIKSGVEELAKKYGCSTICVTKGADGATIYREGEIFTHNGFKIKVINTVGSGDAFLATLISGILNKKENNNIISYANAVGAFVAMHDGAIPKINFSKVSKILLNDFRRSNYLKII